MATGRQRETVQRERDRERQRDRERDRDTQRHTERECTPVRHTNRRKRLSAKKIAISAAVVALVPKRAQISTMSVLTPSQILTMSAYHIAPKSVPSQCRNTSKIKRAPFNS
eukprot:3614605-Rhodomonas_salina.1